MSDKFQVTLANGDQHEVSRTNRAAVRWDIERAIHGWPEIQTAPYLYMTFCCWVEMKANGLYHESFTQFYEVDCVELTPPDPEEETSESFIQKGHSPDLL